MIHSPSVIGFLRRKYFNIAIEKMLIYRSDTFGVVTKLTKIRSVVFASLCSEMIVDVGNVRTEIGDDRIYVRVKE